MTTFGKTRNEVQSWQEEFITNRKLGNNGLANAGRSIVKKRQVTDIYNDDD